MKKFETKTVKVGKKDVEVDVVQVANAGGPPALRAVAKCGNRTAEATLTLGPIGGGLANPEPGQVQRRLDELREQTARQAAVEDELDRQMATAL